MKRLCIYVAVAFLTYGVTTADFLGLKKSSEYVVFPVHMPLDSNGIPGIPDSIQVVSYADNGATKAYSATGAGYVCAGIDTTSDYGGSPLWFVDQIQDIDGVGGNIQLGIQVITWYKNLPTYSFATVQVLTDSLNWSLHTIRDSLNAGETVGAVASKTTDSVNARGAVAIKSGGIPVGAFVTSSITADAIAPAAITVSEIPALQLAIDSINAILDTLQSQDDWIVTRFVANRDTSHAIHVEIDNVNGFNFATDSVRAKANVASFTAGAITGPAWAASAIMAFWNIPFDTICAEGSIFDSLCNFSYVGGSGGGDGVWTTGQRDSVLAALLQTGFKATIQQIIDTVMAMSKRTDTVIVHLDNLAVLSGYKVGGRSITNYHSAADTMWVYDGATLKAIFIARHIGGVGGDKPDSTRVVGP